MFLWRVVLFGEQRFEERLAEFSTKLVGQPNLGSAKKLVIFNRPKMSFTVA